MADQEKDKPVEEPSPVEEAPPRAASSPTMQIPSLSQLDLQMHVDGYKWIMTIAESDPAEYNRIYNGLPAEAKQFVRFLKEKADAVLHPVQQIDPGVLTVVTQVRAKGATDPIILVENARGNLPSKKSLCTIFNELEREGFKLIKNGAAGARFKDGESELIFVFSKNPAYEARLKHSIVSS